MVWIVCDYRHVCGHPLRMFIVVYIPQKSMSYTVSIPSYMMVIYELKKYHCNLEGYVKYKSLASVTRTREALGYV